MQSKITVLPDPFGPMRPVIVPAPTVNETSLTATSPPNLLCKLMSSRQAGAVTDAVSWAHRAESAPRRLLSRRANDGRGAPPREPLGRVGDSSHDSAGQEGDEHDQHHPEQDEAQCHQTVKQFPQDLDEE